MAHQFYTSVVDAFRYINLAFEYRYNPALSAVISHLLCLDDGIECFHYAFWFVLQYYLYCLCREFIWFACLPFPVVAICFFTSSNEKHSTGPSVVGNSSSRSLGVFLKYIASDV